MLATISSEALLARADSFSSEIADRAREFEDQGHISQDLAERMARQGLFRLCNPPTHGGPGASPMDYGRVVETLAAQDGSTGWIVFIGITSAMAACGLAAEVTCDLLASEETITAGVFAPNGRATHCTLDGEEGFRLTGQWQWGSGSPNAHYLSAGGFLVDSTGELLRDAAGRPQQRSFMMPIEQVSLLDTWQVSGMKASGSGHFEVDDLFVPATMTCDPFAARSGDHPLLRFPLFGALGIGIGAVALGLARASLREFTALAGTKTPQGSSRPLAMKSATQRRVALAKANLESARLLFYQAIEKAWETVVAGDEASVEQRADLRLANSYAVQQAASVVDSLYTIAGGSSVYLNSPLQRHFRDIHVATQHMMVNEASLELVGRIELGVETNTAQL